MNGEKLQSLPLGDIRIEDAFWGKYIRLVKDVILPYQWETLNDNVPDAEPSHCIKNFRIAAGEETGTFQGADFPGYGCGKVAGSRRVHPGFRRKG